jgi:predicted transcriptional regulator
MIFPSTSSIKHRRKILGINQKKLAEGTGISQSFIAKLESGKLNPSYKIAVKIFTYIENLEKKTEKSCEQMMQKHVICLDVSDKIKDAILLMKKNGISQIPILNKKDLLGSLSEDKIYSLLTENEREEILERKIADFLEDPFPTLPKHAPISLAQSLLKYSPAIVVLDKNKISGILTKSNLL